MYFTLEVKDYIPTNLSRELGPLHIKTHDLVGISEGELCQMLGFEEGYLPTTVFIDEVPYDVVGQLAERFGFEDESRLYTYGLGSFSPGEQTGITRQELGEDVHEQLSKAERALRQGRKRECQALYEQLLSQRPDDFLVVYMYANALESFNMFTQNETEMAKTASLLERTLSLTINCTHKKEIRRRLAGYYFNGYGKNKGIEAAQDKLYYNAKIAALEARLDPHRKPG